MRSEYQPPICDLPIGHSHRSIPRALMQECRGERSRGQCRRQAVNRVIYECGGLRVDPANRRLTRGAGEIALEPKAFGVLLVLLARTGELVTRDELLDAVWGHRYITPATLNRAMSMLRRVFDDDADHPRFIHTVHGAGYRFIGAVAWGS